MEHGGEQVEICVRARDISCTGISACGRKRRRIGIFFFENRRRREEDPSVVAPPSSVTENKLGVCVGRGCVLEVIVIGLLLDFIDRGCLSSIIKTRP